MPAGSSACATDEWPLMINRTRSRTRVWRSFTVETILSALTTLPPAPDRFRRNLLRLLLVLGVAGMLAWSWFSTEMSLANLSRSGPRVADFLERLFPPDLAWNINDAR